ncbi:MAG: ammonia-forming cytochrome c nitrite reductase subunit c552 [Methanosarcinaceae archaeon]|nr:ammonia-forming cytochrome c nitrite reductase subunit c552 [Methanosarcinaceae archaeon]
MKKEHKNILLIGGAVLLVVLICTLSLFLVNNQPLDTTPTRFSIPDNETDSSVWGNFYPLQYESYLKNSENKDSKPHVDSFPYLTEMYKGTGYGAEFNEPRGHLYALDDILNVNSKRWESRQANCFVCKSPQIPDLMDKYDFSKLSFEDAKSEINQTIGCYNCHDTKTLDLKVKQKPLLEALDRMGVDINNATKQDMKSLVCAQCHVSYYFTDENQVKFPWDNGLTAEKILKYYDESNFAEMYHPDTKTPLVKPRHAEYEMFMGSTHQSAGLSCADCHMPYMRDGDTKYHSHYWSSPLQHINQSCLVCHTQGEDWVLNRVSVIQNNTKESQNRAGEAVVEAINAISKAQNTTGVNESILNEAREMHRKGQWYLDFVFVTNGYGFHNPGETMSNLNKAIDYSHKATILANKAILNADTE